MCRNAPSTIRVAGTLSSGIESDFKNESSNKQYNRVSISVVFYDMTVFVSIYTVIKWMIWMMDNHWSATITTLTCIFVLLFRVYMKIWELHLFYYWLIAMFKHFLTSNLPSTTYTYSKSTTPIGQRWHAHVTAPLCTLGRQSGPKRPIRPWWPRSSARSFALRHPIINWKIFQYIFRQV